MKYAFFSGLKSNHHYELIGARRDITTTIPVRKRLVTTNNGTFKRLRKKFKKHQKTNICGASQEDFTIINGETLKDPLSAVSKKNLRITTSGAQLDDIYAYVHSKCLTVDQVC